MMKSFTILRKIAFTLSMLSIGLTAFAQGAMVLKISAPASVAGTYATYRSSFGPQDVNAITDKATEVAVPANACSAISNSLTDKIGFVDRGGCDFVVKVKNAQNAGAIAVIICNTDTDPLNPGGTDASITIKSFLIEKSECDRIKLALASGPVSASIVERQCEPVPPGNAIWGAKSGEGDFDGGLNGWTITTEEGKGWVWTADGDCRASFMPSPCNMATPTICNGAISINSNALDVSGDCQAVCPSGIISPNIDLSNVTIGALNLQFNQTIREFGSRYFVLTSYDNGSSWPDTLEINSDVFSNDAVNFNQVVRVGLCGIDPSIKQIRLQFFIQANYYYWGIDDVFLINEAFADPQVNNNFWAVPPSLKTPVSQASTFPLLSDIRNNGAITSPLTKLTAKVSTVTLNAGQLPAGTGTLSQIYSQVNDYGDVGPCEQIENIPFANQYMQPSTTGLYQLDYTISSDDNKFSGNDTRFSRFMMTPGTFSNGLTEAERGTPYLSRFIGGVNPNFLGANFNFWSIGTYYHFPKGSKAVVKEFKFGVDTINNANNPTYSAQINCNVYKVLDNSSDPGNITSTERVLVGTGFFEDTEEMFIDNTTAGRRRLKFDIKNVDGSGPLALEDNTGYIFMVHVRAFSGKEYFPFLGFNPNTSNNTSRWAYTEATNLAYEANNEFKSFGTCVSRGATETDDVHARSLATNFFKRLHSEVTIQDVTGTEDELEATAFNIYPNPASNEVYVDMNLKKVSKNVEVAFYNIAGKKMLTQGFSNVRTESLKVNTSALTTGMYVARIITDEGSSSVKLMIKN